jgi:TolB-like protein/DNA-binding winged helix-turn-helix (wHTH) protein
MCGNSLVSLHLHDSKAFNNCGKRFHDWSTSVAEVIESAHEVFPRLLQVARSRRFGVFEVNLQARELRKHGVRVRLSGHPFEILALLLERPGEIVTREQLRARLWHADTFVDFEHGLNTAVKKLRVALGDSPTQSRYVETVPRIGYRFVAPVETAGEQAVKQASDTADATRLPGPDFPLRSGETAASGSSVGWVGKFTVATLVLIGAALALNIGNTRDRLLALLRPAGVPVGNTNSTTRTLPAIAVLPLENLSGDRDQDYFVEGITDELTTELAQFQGLRVVSRTSAMHYKGTNKTALQIGKELGVGTLIEGTVERAGDRVRIRAQLIDCIGDRHLWAKSYDREFKDVLRLQGELARDIVEQTRGNVILTQPRPPSADFRPVNPSAYEDYLKGRYFWNRRTRDGFRTAIDYFQAAIAKDPTYAVAYAGLADSFLLLGGYGFDEQKDTMSKAKAAALKALAIDDGLAEAYTSLGLIAEQADWNWAEAERNFKRAIQLDPNYSVAHHWYGDGYLAAVGKADEAITELRKAHELDPLSLVIATDLAKRLCFAGNYDEGMEQFRKVFEIDPNFTQAHYYLSQAYELKGLFPEAIAEAKKIKPPDDIPYAVGQLGRIYGRLSRRREALAIVNQLQRPSNRTYVDPGYIANIYIALGEKDSAFVWLERAFEQRSSAMEGLKCDRLYYDPIRSDPRFGALVRRVGLADSNAGGESQEALGSLEH